MFCRSDRRVPATDLVTICWLADGSDGRTPITVRWGYSAKAPYTVSAVALDDSPIGEASWLLARDLLAEGQYHGVGAGGVWIEPSAVDPTEVVLHWYSATGAGASIGIERFDLEVFLRRTYQAVPRGAENDWWCLDELFADKRDDNTVVP